MIRHKDLLDRYDHVVVKTREGERECHPRDVKPGEIVELPVSDGKDGSDFDFFKVLPDLTPSGVVEQLLSEDSITERGENPIVKRIKDEVEQYLGDVAPEDLDPDSPEYDARMKEECWTLCIDKANDLVKNPEEARRYARLACFMLGYGEGRTPLQQQKAQPVWPPRPGHP